MKLTLFLVLFFFLSASAYTQKVNISVKSATTLNDVLRQIKDQSGVRILYDAGKTKQVLCDRMVISNLDIAEALAKVLKGTRFEFFEEGAVYIVREMAIQQADILRVCGKVTDKEKLPIPGVTVQLKGYTYGSVTNAKGEYWLGIPNPPEKFSLVFSFVGMETQEIKYVGKDTINVVMREDVKTLEDVVVTGYMKMNKGGYVGAVTTVKMDETLIAGENSIDQMLQGAVPGMSVLMRTGQVGASARVRVRGTSTLLGNQEPVWVVDGVIQRDPFPMQEGDNSLASDADNLRLIAGNCISWLNPNDIETLTVLKDASATAIYGSQAANGVIVITTKKANSDRLTVSYSGSMTVGQKPSYGLYNLMNSQEKMQLSKDIFDEKLSYRSNVLPVGYSYLLDQLQSKLITYDEFVEQFRKYEYQNTDWFDLLFRNSFSHQHSLSISGGSKILMNRTSFNYNETKGEAIGNDVTTLSFNSNKTLRLNDRLQINFTFNGADRRANGFAYGVDPFAYASTTSRVIPVYNEDGSLYYHKKMGKSSSVLSGVNYYDYNILNELDNTGNENQTQTLKASVDLQLEILPGLQYQGLYSYGIASSTIKSWATEFSYHITNIRGYEYGDSRVLPNSLFEQSSQLPFGGLLQEENMSNRSYTFRNSLVYNKVFNEVHSVTLNLGIEANSEKMTGSNNKRYGYLRYRGEKFADVPMPTVRWGGAGEQPDGPDRTLIEEMRTGSSVTNRENNLLSEYITAVYSYDNCYVVNFNARLDASNRFAQDEKKKFRPTWSAGVKWRLGSEHFMQNQRVLDALDVSASYGYQGNAVSSVSPYLIATDGGLDPYTNLYKLNVKSLPYPGLGWEKTKSWNLSVDASFFRSRFTVMANVFGKNSDVLGSRNIPAENGMMSATVFGTKMENRGYELAVSFIAVQTKDFTWQLSLNTGVTRNEMSRNEKVNTLADYLGGSAIVDGESYSTLWSFEFDKLDPEDGKPLFKKLDIEPTSDMRDFLVKSGKLEPDFSGGLFTRLRYKTLSFQANFAVSFGSQRRLPDLYDMSNGQEGLPLPDQNSSRVLVDRWKKPGDEERTVYPSLPTAAKNSSVNGGGLILPTYPSTVGQNRYVAYNMSDIRVADADFIRCRQLSLNYNFAPELLRQLHLKNLSVGLSMTNPFLITFDKKWDGYDPETGGWPARKTYSLSLSATF